MERALFYRTFATQREKIQHKKGKRTSSKKILVKRIMRKLKRYIGDGFSSFRA
jgi:uncharacterized protein YggU (UPF0235/DUF167 family)